MARSSDTGWRGSLARWWAGIAPRRQGRGADESTREDPHATHTGRPRDRGPREPLGPITPDPERPVGDTAEAHDEISPHDLPAGHPGRPEAERLADGRAGPHDPRQPLVRLGGRKS